MSYILYTKNAKLIMMEANWQKYYIFIWPVDHFDVCSGNSQMWDLSSGYNMVVVKLCFSMFLLGIIAEIVKVESWSEKQNLY